MKQAFNQYKMWIMHTIMCFITLSLMFTLVALFFRVMYWMFTTS